MVKNKKTQSKHSIGKDALILTSSRILTSVVLMMVAMILSHSSTLEEYGTYSLMLLIINLASSITMMGLPNSINYFLGRQDDNKERVRFISVYFTLSTFLSILTGIILVLITPLIEVYFKNELIKSCWFFLLTIPWSKVVLTSIENILIVYKKTYLLGIFKIINSLSILIGLIIVRLLNLNFITYVLTYVIIQMLFSLIVYILSKSIVGKIYIHFDVSYIKKIFIFSIPLGLASVVGTINIELDKLIIGAFFNTEQLAIYANASREMPVTIIASVFTAVLLPQLARLMKKDEVNLSVKLWGDSVNLSYIFICFIAVGLFVYAPEVITLLYSEKYLPGVGVFRVFCLVLLLRTTYFGMILNSTGNTKFIFYSSLISLLLNMVLNYLFYLIFGFIGPAIATLITQGLTGYVQLLFTSKRINIRLRKLMQWNALLNITFINIAMGLVFWVIKKELNFELIFGEVIESVILASIWGAIYFLIMFKTIKIKWGALKVGN